MKSLRSLLMLLLGAAGAQGETKATISVQPGPITYELDPSVQHIPLDPYDKTLRPPPAKIPSSFEIHIGTSVFRDGVRCGYTIFTAYKRAKFPERLRFGILEQLLDSDSKCLDEYCKLARVEWPEFAQCRYQEHVQVVPRPAAEAAGCTTARHQQNKLIGNEEFCLQVDSHTIFTNGWDELMLNEWKRINNEMAILTVYPHDLHDFFKENGDNNAPEWIPHLCTTLKGGNGLTRIGGASIKRGATFPQLGALWGGGLSFSKCHAERNVPVDSHTPWLWDGEEFLRSVDYWTHGYDLYSPSRLGNVIYHNYSKKPASFWESPVNKAVKLLDTERTHNRVRLRLGMGFVGQVDAMELDKYKFGTARTFEQYLRFANVSLSGYMNETNSCQQLHWVPYSNATAVENIVGTGWELFAPAPGPVQPAAAGRNFNADDQNGEPDMAEMGEGEGHGGREMAEMEEKDVEDMATQLKLSEGMDGERLTLRQGRLSSGRRPGISATAWGLLAVVIIVLFATLSNDRISYAIRQSCFGSATHHSRD